IKEDADYAGVRLVFRGRLENARSAMQIDIGFGDVVVPATARTEYPLLLADLPAPILHGYRRESAVAEKFQAMGKLGLFNSRLKAFFRYLAAGAAGRLRGGPAREGAGGHLRPSGHGDSAATPGPDGGVCQRRVQVGPMARLPEQSPAGAGSRR